MKKFLLLFAMLVSAVLTYAEDYTIEGDIITIAEYYPAAEGGQNDWYVHFKDANRDWKIALDLKCPDGTFAGTYSIQDTILDECYASHEDEYGEEVHYIFTSLNVTVTMPDGITDPKDGCEISGTASDAEGNTFSFHMKKNAPIQPKSTVNVLVNVAVAEWPSERNGGAYYELTEQSDASKKWILSLAQLQGEVTQKEGGIDTTASGRFDASTDERLLAIDNAKVSQTLNAKNMSIQVEAQLVMTDSVQYNLSFTNQLPVKREDTLVFTDLQIDRSYSEYGSTTLNASNDSLELDFEITDYAEIPGEYTAENTDIYVNLYKDFEVYQYQKQAIDYARTEVLGTDSVVLSARFLAADSVIYTITASYVPQTATDTLSITKTTDQTELGDGIKDGNGFYFNAQDMEDGSLYHVWISVNADSLGGHFTEADLNNNSLILIADTVRGMNHKFYISRADLTLTSNGMVYTLSGTCQAGKYFVNLSLSANYPGITYDSPDEDVDITFTKADSLEIEYDTEWQSYIGVMLHNGTRNDELYLMLHPETYDSTRIPAGVYEIGGYDGSYADAGTFDDMMNAAVASYYGKLNELGNLDTPLWFLTAGTVTVGEDGSIEVQATNSYMRTVHITYTNATGLQEQAASQKAQKFLRNGQLIIRKNGIEYNAAGQVIK